MVKSSDHELYSQWKDIYQNTVARLSRSLNVTKSAHTQFTSAEQLSTEQQQALIPPGEVGMRRSVQLNIVGLKQWKKNCFLKGGERNHW